MDDDKGMVAVVALLALFMLIGGVGGFFLGKEDAVREYQMQLYQSTQQNKMFIVDDDVYRCFYIGGSTDVYKKLNIERGK